MNADEIGELGEGIFGTWCLRVGITANPVRKDKRGWDFVLQFSTGESERICFVQVKTTLAKAPRASIKLSNWQRMAQGRNRTGMDAVRLRASSVAVRGWKDIGRIGGQSGSKSSRRAATRTRSRAATA